MSRSLWIGFFVGSIFTSCLLFASQAAEKKLYGLKFHDHNDLTTLSAYSYTVLNKGRIQVFELKDDIQFDDLPSSLQDNLFEVDMQKLSRTPQPAWRTKAKQMLGLVQKNSEIESIVANVTKDSYRPHLETLVGFGSRSTDSSIDWVMSELESYGYTPVHDYNIEVWKEGTESPDEYVIILGHMDTVSRTVGADDNASGAAAVLEAARVLANVQTKKSILFLITEDEEHGLLGAKEYVRRAEANGTLGNIKFAVNMDMIGYNSNRIVDLETKPQFESVVDWMTELTHMYTSLSPNKVLQAWGSDHVPFIDAGVPTLLTIEHWDTHTPCWHRSCDTIDTINFDYAVEIVRLNIAAILEKAELVTNPQ